MKVGRNRWIEEKREMEERHQSTLAELRRRWTEEISRSDELKEEFGTERRKYAEQIMSLRERLEMTEQELDRVSHELDSVKENEIEEENRRTKDEIEIQLIEKDDELIKIKDDLEVRISKKKF